MKISKKVLFGLLATASTLALGVAQKSLADETIGEKAETTYDSVKKDAKKTSRKAKRNHRDSAGNKNVLKDAGDEMKNAGDEVEYQAKKAKRKAD